MGTEPALAVSVQAARPAAKRPLNETRGGPARREAEAGYRGTKQAHQWNPQCRREMPRPRVIGDGRPARLEEGGQETEIVVAAPLESTRGRPGDGADLRAVGIPSEDEDPPASLRGHPLREGGESLDRP